MSEKEREDGQEGGGERKKKIKSCVFVLCTVVIVLERLHLRQNHSQGFYHIENHSSGGFLCFLGEEKNRDRSTYHNSNILFKLKVRISIANMRQKFRAVTQGEPFDELDFDIYRIY